MSDTNPYITNAIKGIQSPVTFDSGTAGDDNKGAVQQLIDLISREGTDPNVPRGYLDEMSPACRDSMIATLIALKTAIVNA